MRKCKVCGVVLSGLAGKIRKLFFKQFLAGKGQDICNKCKESKKNDQFEKKAAQAVETEDQKYQCPACKRMIHQSHALEHIKTEEYLMKLISKDHPKWGKEEPVCKECVDYYRKLVEDAEI